MALLAIVYNIYTAMPGATKFPFAETASLGPTINGLAQTLIMA
jgi:hypothetical protein